MKNVVRVLLALALSAAMLLSLAACEMGDYIEYNPDRNTQEETLSVSDEAKKTVTDFFTALVNKDKAAAEKCLKLNSQNTHTDDENKKADPATDALKENFYSSFSYEILDVQTADDQTVNVTAKLDTLDMTKILPEYLKYAIEISTSAELDDSLSEEGVNEALKSYMTSLLNAQDAQRREVTINIKVIKSDDNWLIETNEDFFDAITGGMITIGKELNKSDY